MKLREAVALGLALCQSVYPNIKLTPETPRAWEELLKDIEPQFILSAFKIAVSETEYATLPAVGRVRELAAGMNKRKMLLKSSLIAERELLLRNAAMTEDEKQRMAFIEKSLRSVNMPLPTKEMIGDDL